ncbi:putative nuclear hormone receptor HR38 [Orchesella cincta]|uniref:Putative nuclear hormone receptor HR38 n=1 Tax=Orchesella cincta TaxID=48709 RepID=A0A1D2MSQ5_ORCCI|nr:putative nuclear hormone receptor HR38 [Orchesella cincta]
MKRCWRPAAAGPPSPPVSLITALVRAHLDSSPDTQTKDYSMYQEPPYQEHDLPQDKDSIVNHPEHIQFFFKLLTNCFDVIKGMAERIPGFNEFTRHDQELLLQSASLELFVLRLAYRIQQTENTLTFCNGTVLHREQCKPVFGDWYDAIIEFSNSLQSMQMDLSTMACLETLVLVTDRHSLEDPVKVEQLQMKIIGSLRDHVTYNCEAQKKPHYFSRVLAKLPELRTISVQGLQRIFYLKLEDLIPAPPVIEAMFSSTLPF